MIKLPKLFRGYKNNPQPKTGQASSSLFEAPAFSGVSPIKRHSMSIPAVYRCVQCVSDAVAQMPIQIFKVDSKGHKKPAVSHPAFYLLNREPSRYMTRYMLLKSVVTSMLLRGNAFVKVHRDYDGNATALEFLHPDTVTVIDNEQGHIMAYAHPRFGWIEPCDMVHVLNFSRDGEHGISTIKHALGALELASQEEEHAREFFESGASLSGVVTVNHTLTQKQKEDFLDKWKRKMSGGNSVALLEADMNYKPIGVNPVDAQLLETRKYSVVDICRFFGVSPAKAYDMTSESYASLEASQLAFLTDTLQPLLEKIELEFERKIFRPKEKFKYDVRFDTTSLIRTDKAAQATYYTKLFNIGALTTNEIRMMNNLEPVEHGDQPFVQSNLVPFGGSLPETDTNGGAENP